MFRCSVLAISRRSVDSEIRSGPSPAKVTAMSVSLPRWAAREVPVSAQPRHAVPRRGHAGLRQRRCNRRGRRDRVGYRTRAHLHGKERRRRFRLLRRPKPWITTPHEHQVRVDVAMRATCETDIPGTSVRATIWRFSSCDDRRRVRCRPTIVHILGVHSPVVDTYPLFPTQ